VTSTVEIAITVAALVIICAAGFFVGDRVPLRRAQRRFDGCRVTLWRADGVGQFRVVAGRHVIGRSEPFEVPAGPVPDDGAIARAHDDLLARLRELGWEPAPVQVGQWYETRLVERVAIPA
jgi:hypothetical protein